MPDLHFPVCTMLLCAVFGTHRENAGKTTNTPGNRIGVSQFFPELCFVLCSEFTLLWQCCFGGLHDSRDGEHLRYMYLAYCCLQCSFPSAGRKLYYLSNLFVSAAATACCLSFASSQKPQVLPCFRYYTGQSWFCSYHGPQC